MSASIKKCKTLPQIPQFANSTSTFGQSIPTPPIRHHKRVSPRKAKILPTPPQLITNYTSIDSEYDSNTNLLENSPRTNEEWREFWSQIGVSNEHNHSNDNNTGDEILANFNNTISIINYNQAQNVTSLSNDSTDSNTECEYDDNDILIETDEESTHNNYEDSDRGYDEDSDEDSHVRQPTIMSQTLETIISNVIYNRRQIVSDNVIIIPIIINIDSDSDSYSDSDSEEEDPPPQYTE